LWWGSGKRAFAALCVVLALSHAWAYRYWMPITPAAKAQAIFRPDALAEPLRLPTGAAPASYRIALGGPSSWINFRLRDRGGWRAAYMKAGGVDLNMLHGVASISGYSPLMLREFARFAGDMRVGGGPRNPDFFQSAALDLLNVRYVVAPPREVFGFPPETFAGLELESEEGGLRIYRNPRAPGLVWGVESVGVSTNAVARWGEQPRNEFDVHRRAVVGPEDALRLAGRRFVLPTRVSARHVDGNTVAVDVDTLSEAFLASSLIHYPGWKASVDGVPVPLHRVNGLFYGLTVPAGSHRLLLRYRPASLGWGLLCATLAGAVLVAGTLFDLRRRRKGGPAKQGILTEPTSAG